MDILSLSTVTPVYNGAKYLQNLVLALNALRVSLDRTSCLRLAECIFVLDDPKDNSEAILLDLASQYHWLTILTLSKNYGQHPATICGILHTSSDWVVTLDEDLQHDPSLIPSLLSKVVTTNSDICYANAEGSTHQSVIKDTLAIVWKKVMSRLLNNENIQHFNSFRLIRGDIARASAAICRHDTYYDIALSWFSKRITNTVLPLIDIRNVENVQNSGYSFWGLVRHAKRMFMSSKVKFFRWGIPIGIFAFLCSIAISFYAITSIILNYETILNKGWASTILVVLFFGGLTTLLSGFILESVSEVLLSVNGKPTFFVINRTKDKLLTQVLKEMEQQ